MLSIHYYYYKHNQYKRMISYANNYYYFCRVQHITTKIQTSNFVVDGMCSSTSLVKLEWMNSLESKIFLL